MWILYVILALIAVFFAVILIRAAAFRPKKTAERPREEVSFDGDKAIEALQKLIRCRTVSYYDPAMEDDGEFEKLIALLPELYPHVTATCSLTRLPDSALLFRWEGKSHDEPSVMMAHYDVVPVEEENWEKPPFEAIIEDGVLWGCHQNYTQLHR